MTQRTNSLVGSQLAPSIIFMFYRPCCSLLIFIKMAKSSIQALNPWMSFACPMQTNFNPHSYFDLNAFTRSLSTNTKNDVATSNANSTSIGETVDKLCGFFVPWHIIHRAPLTSCLHHPSFLKFEGRITRD